MNIKILDSWLREYLKTSANAEKIAEALSLTSVSVERLEKSKNDYIYDIEITTNRPDLMSVVGLAREAAVVLPQYGIDAEFIKPVLKKAQGLPIENLPIKIENNPSLVNRIVAVVLEVELKGSPSNIKERLEASGIRSLNNLIDVTNYVMRETGHPAHVFDYDRLSTKTLIVREAKKGEKIKTLDEKEHTLKGGDIIADNGEGEIVDLLGVMGTANSVVTNQTKRILYFLDNNKPGKIRTTSMSLGIRSEAAVLNEKGVDPEIAMDAMLRGIELYKAIAGGKLLSNIIDIYPNKVSEKKITLSEEKTNSIIGIEIPRNTIHKILSGLGFRIKNNGNNFDVIVPSWRAEDIEIEEDLIEEVARVYGYHKLPSIIPPLPSIPQPYNLVNDTFYWEKRIKNALKYWGFSEVYTYSMVSEELLEGPPEEAIKLANPLSEDMVFLRKTLVPSLLNVVKENQIKTEVKVFELSNVYIPRNNDLPKEILKLAGVIKKQNINFFEIKGIVEQLISDLGIKELVFKDKDSGGIGSDIYIKNELLGTIELLEEDLVDFELNFEIILEHAKILRDFTPIPKFPPTIEDIRLNVSSDISYQDVVSKIKEQSDLIAEVDLLDTYKDKKTFRIKYQDKNKTLTTEEVAKVREKVLLVLEKDFQAKIS